jgi:hypothetical protein
MSTVPAAIAKAAPVHPQAAARSDRDGRRRRCSIAMIAAIAASA